MAYTVTNFKTKKLLKEAVMNYMNHHDGVKSSFASVRCYQPGLGPDLSNYTGKISLEGPHYPAPHTWYAEAELRRCHCFQSEMREKKMIRAFVTGLATFVALSLLSASTLLWMLLVHSHI